MLRLKVEISLFLIAEQTLYYDDLGVPKYSEIAILRNQFHLVLPSSMNYNFKQHLLSLHLF